MIRRSKYGAKRTVVDGLRFDSQAEARHWRELCLLQQAGVISQLERQVPFRLDVHGVHICTFVADFVYRREDGTKCVADVKGFRTPTYRLKRKLMLACWGIVVTEVEA